MKKWFKLALTLAAIGPLTLTAPLANSQDSSFPRGKVALQVADTGTFMARCRDCQETVESTNIRDTVVLHNQYSRPYTHFLVVPVGGGKIALKSDNGKYVGRCNRCIEGGTTPDFLVIQHNNPNSPNAQFTPELLPNGNYGLKNTGKYVARCRGCSPTAAATGNRDVVTLAVLKGASPATRPFAQWNIISIPPEY